MAHSIPYLNVWLFWTLAPHKQHSLEMADPLVTPKITSKFVLLSTARSGTTNVIATLGQHPDIYVHREVFLKNYRNTVRPEFHEAFDVEELRKDQVSYVQKLLSFTPGPSCVGFKVFFVQAPKACNFLMADRETKKIILERKNHLAQYSSLLISQASGMSHQRANANKPRTQVVESPVRFDAEAFSIFSERRQNYFDRYEQQSKGDVFFMTYTEMNDAVFAKLFKFLDLPPIDVSSQFKKLNSGDILSRFHPDDHQQVRDCLDQLGHPEWVSEEMEA